jgi:hypothetical protein
MKTTGWMIYEYYPDDYNDDMISDSMTTICGQGYEVFKISEIPYRARLDKPLNRANDRPTNYEHSLGNGDYFVVLSFTRGYYQMVDGL